MIFLFLHFIQKLHLHLRWLEKEAEHSRRNGANAKEDSQKHALIKMQTVAR